MKDSLRFTSAASPVLELYFPFWSEIPKSHFSSGNTFASVFRFLKEVRRVGELYNLWDVESIITGGESLFGTVGRRDLAGAAALAGFSATSGNNLFDFGS